MSTLWGRRLFGLSLCALAGPLLLFGLGRAGQTDRAYSETLFVFGTLVEVVIYGESEDRARAATAALGHQFQRLHRDWHAWRDGELTHLNAALAKGEETSVSADLAAVLREGQALAVSSGGLFDPGIGEMIELWGFHADTPPTGAPPSAVDIAVIAAKKPSIRDLVIEGTTVSSSNPAVQLDLGGYAKGAALEHAVLTLQGLGIENAVLNAGGDVKVIGQHGSRAWRVAIRDPFVWGAVATLSVAPGEAVFTSGNYERFLETDGQRFTHIIDPRSGRPAQDIVSATVVTHNASLADAAATALSVAGPGAWHITAENMGVSQALLIDGSGQLYATPAMAARLELARSPDEGPGPMITLPEADPKFR